MRGKVTSISGATVCVDLRGLQLYDRVYVGHKRLSGEVVHLEKEHTTVQVFEDTHGLSVGEPAEGTRSALTVMLGPGLLGEIFDGLQRPLSTLRQMSGDFIRETHEASSLDLQRQWNFSAEKQAGTQVAVGELLGKIDEGHLSHPIYSRIAGEIAQIANGPNRLEQPLATFTDGQLQYAWQNWSVRRPRCGGHKRPA